MIYTRRAALFFLVFAVSLGCNSTPKPKPGTKETLPAPVVFEPATYYAKIEAGDTRYPNLFSPDSYALWVSPEIAAVKKQKDVESGVQVDEALELDAANITANYFVFECRFESAFPDSSIAYDAVGLRNLEVFLATPEGNRIRPIQRILDPHAGEQQRQALKDFSRDVVLVFPKRDILVSQPTITRGAEGVRLVVEGFNSEFYFEWQNASGAASGGTMTPTQTAAATSTGFTEFFGKVRALAHIFD